jgi:PDZ domain-containing protein
MSTVGAPGRVRHVDLKVRRLVHHPALTGCSPRELRRIAAAADETLLTAGDTLLTEGHVSFWFFLIDRGTAAILEDGEIVGVLGPGSHVGEVPILGHRPSPTTVVALTDVTAFLISSQRFIPFVDDIRVLRRQWAHLRSEVRYPPLRRWFRRSRVPPRAIEPFSTYDAVPPPPLTRRQRFARVGVMAAFIVAVTAFGTQYHPGPIVVTPGHPIDITDDITISGVPARHTSGHYLLTPVEFQRPTAFGLVRALVSHHRRIVNERGAQPTADARRQARAAARAAFRQSRIEAAAAAARAAGLPVTVTGTGARVTSVAAGSGAASSLLAGDVIVMADGKAVHTASDLDAIVAGHRPGARLSVTVERDGAHFTTPVITNSTADGRAASLGATVETRNRSLVLPFAITFKHHDLGGPSAGLVYALAISDMLDTGDFAHGRTVAATGTIDIDGHIGDVGYVTMKALAARSGRALVFLAPAGQCDGVGGVTCIEEGDLRAALNRLR